MKFLDRIFGKKENRPNKVVPVDARLVSHRIPWGLLIGPTDDLCLVLEDLGRPIVAAAIVMNLDFFEPDGTIAPVRLAVTFADGDTAMLELAQIIGDALSEIIVAPSVLICTVGPEDIGSMVPAAVFMANQTRPPSEQQPGPEATVYAATVLKILHPGTAALPWRALVRLDKEGTRVAEKVVVSLYPPPPLEVGMTTAVIGTLEAPSGTEPYPQLTKDAAQNPLARLAGFAEPFQLEMAIGASTPLQEAKVRRDVGIVLSTMGSLAAEIYGYVDGTLLPHVRPLGAPLDPITAAATERFAVTRDEAAAIDWDDPDGFGFEPADPPGPAANSPSPLPWGILDLPGYEPSIYFERISVRAPIAATLVVYDRPLEVGDRVASPFSVSLKYPDGSERVAILAEADDETYDQIRVRYATRILELDGETVGFDYPIDRQIEVSLQA